ncbi:unnamed protein product [Pleuronectes platessa]|uniref:Uncharacterized protein n=1 Tax=Pleuronectes platessa TaxID=8262 RepID=A0A9N7YMG5_PLEPL|nr:unnamed protein product [Pleuronectes platessa]
MVSSRFPPPGSRLVPPDGFYLVPPRLVPTGAWVPPGSSLFFLPGFTLRLLAPHGFYWFHLVPAALVCSPALVPATRLVPPGFTWFPPTVVCPPVWFLTWVPPGVSYLKVSVRSTVVPACRPRRYTVPTVAAGVCEFSECSDRSASAGASRCG